jgi:hypothetical protein
MHTKEDMQVLVLDQARPRVGGTIDELTPFGQRDADPELLAQTTPGRGGGGLSRPRVTAAGVRPKVGEVVFHPGAPLQQQVALGVEDQDREGPVQLAIQMDVHLAATPQLSVGIVDQDDAFVRIPLRHAL